MSALAHCRGPRAHIAVTVFELAVMAKSLRAEAGGEGEIERHLAARFERLRQGLLASAAENVPALLFDDGDNEEPDEEFP